MSEQYTAWDGNEYPWPPPDGWVLGSDGRYWPEGQQPTTAPEAATFGAMPPQSPAPPPASGALPPPGHAPPPGAMPPPGPQAPGTVAYGTAPTKSSKAGWWILGILLVLMALGVGGCFIIAATITQGAEEFGNSLEDLGDEFTRRSEASQAIGVESCSVIGGVPTASGTVTNPRSEASSYFIEIQFLDTSNGALLGTADTSVFEIEPGAREQWELTAPTSGFEGAVQCDRGPDSIRIAD